jgi:glutamate-ammonia-ligase adenylyltransferase
MPGSDVRKHIDAEAFPAGLFADHARAEKNLLAIHSLFLTAGSTFPHGEFTEALRGHLLRSPDPDMALNNLVRFTETSLSRTSMFNDLLHFPPLFDLLMSLFGSSQYFADILVRDPELFRWLTAAGVYDIQLPASYYQGEVHRILGMFSGVEKRLGALRRFYRREILRIGARDLMGKADLVATTAELSTMADVLIDASYRTAIEQLQDRYGPKPETPFSVIGLGKLGGTELNYSSDVDLLFVYAEEGTQVSGTRTEVSFHEYFNKLAERITRNLSSSLPEGYLYRVDTRLRPESGAGPLARSLNSSLLYYESRGELWERQMLIKARPVGGDINFGFEFLRQLEPFVFPRTHLEHPGAAASRLKARIEAELAGEENIKLRSGGIRDVEFTVQVLQLLHGGHIPAIRDGNTLAAIGKLCASGLLSEKEGEVLADAYRFYRTVEHRLQMVVNTQTHSIPRDQAARRRLARQLGFDRSESMMEALSGHLESVRSLFSAILSPEKDSIRTTLEQVMEEGSREEEIIQVLERYGLRDGRTGMRHLRTMMTGSALTPAVEFGTRVRDAFRTIADRLMTEVSATAVPDLTLANFSILSSAQKFPEQFYRQLDQEGFRKLVLRVCAVSPRLVKVVAQTPSLFDEIAANIVAPDVLPSADAPSLVRFKATLSRIRRKRLPLAVLALGKYGSGELGLDADLDLLFIGEVVRGTSQERIEKAAQDLMNRLGAVTEEGRLYDVDARLRPEGKNAPLATDIGAYRSYLENRASLWERQSLLRIRFVWGDGELGQRVLRIVHSYVYDRPLPEDWVGSIVSMRRAMEKRRRTAGSDFVDLKHGAGGMADVEFLAQMIQLAPGRGRDRLCGLRTVDVLSAAPKHVLSKQDAKELISAYRMFREIEKLTRLTLEERSSLLPEGNRLEILSRCYDNSDGTTLASGLRGAMDRVRRVFLDAAGRLSGNT